MNEELRSRTRDLPDGPREHVRQYVPWDMLYTQNCSLFLEWTQYMPFPEFVADRDAFIAMRESLIYTLRKFRANIQRLRMYKWASLGSLQSVEDVVTPDFLEYAREWDLTTKFDEGHEFYFWKQRVPPSIYERIDRLNERWQDRPPVPDDENERIRQVVQMMEACQAVSFIKQELREIPAAMKRILNTVKMANETGNQGLLDGIRDLTLHTHMLDSDIFVEPPFHGFELEDGLRRGWILLQEKILFNDDSGWPDDIFDESIAHDDALFAHVLSDE